MFADTNYEDFKKDVLKLTQIDLNAYKEKQMRRRIDSLAEKHECTTYKQYYSMLVKDKKAFDEFINFLTINVSEFYRNPDQWKLLVNTYLPELIQKFGPILKVWSAACSTGDEPYSLVMALSEKINLASIRINATDLDKQVLAQAKVGLYDKKSIVSVPQHFKEKYFEQVGGSFKISDEIKKHVDFKQHNLLSTTYPSDMNMIVCRNVLIYFTEETKQAIYEKFAKALKPGGLLFIGSTEQIMEYKSMGFKRRSSFFYEKE